MPRAKRGFTLIEILVATAVAVLIMGAITSVFYYLMVIPPQQTDQLNAENQLRLSLDWIQNDGVQAYSFTLNENPCSIEEPPHAGYYGYFTSYNTSKQTTLRYVAYRYEAEQLIREESVDCELPYKTTTIAFHIAGMGNVTFDCGGDDPCEGDQPITVNMTVTLNPDSQNKVRKTISITDTRYIEMRAEP